MTDTALSDPLLRKTEVAKELGICERHLDRLSIRDQRIMIGPRSPRWRLSTVETFKRSLEAAAA